MSYEGYTQYLCKEGHAWTEDCYVTQDKPECPACFAPAIWQNMVNTTNGSYEDDKRIDGYVELKQKNKKTCKHCKSVLELTFEIPKNKGVKMNVV